MFHIYLWLFLLTLFAIFAWAYTVKYQKQWQKMQDQLEEDRLTFSDETDPREVDLSFLEGEDKFYTLLNAANDSLNRAFNYIEWSHDHTEAAGYVRLADRYLAIYQNQVDELIQAL